MAFKIHSTAEGRVPAIEYLPCGAITPKVGMALTQTSGNLSIAAGSTAPSYISMCERETACTAGELIPVIRVHSGDIYETTCSAAITSIKHGNKVTIAAGGLEVTATTTDGVAEVIGFDGTAAGSAVRVRF